MDILERRMLPVRSATFMGKRYKISLDERLDGYADAPEFSNGKREVWINPDLFDERRLDVIIHESLHACWPEAGENVVDRTARDIARFLWRLGYRTK